MATRDLTRRFAELRVLQHGVEGSVSESKRPGDAYSESGLLDVSESVCASCVFAVRFEILCRSLLSVDLAAQLPRCSLPLPGAVRVFRVGDGMGRVADAHCGHAKPG